MTDDADDPWFRVARALGLDERGARLVALAETDPRPVFAATPAFEEAWVDDPLDVTTDVALAVLLWEAGRLVACSRSTGAESFALDLEQTQQLRDAGVRLRVEGTNEPAFGDGDGAVELVENASTVLARHGFATIAIRADGDEIPVVPLPEPAAAELETLVRELSPHPAARAVDWL